MLKLPNQLTDPQANEIVKAFVNERLISLMEEIILDEVAWDMALAGELGEDAMTKSFEEMVDLAALMNDMEFAENVSMTYLPEDFPVDRANQEFFGLYNLLKADKEYVPDLVKEYILYAIIFMEIEQTDMINEDIADGLFEIGDEMEEPFGEIPKALKNITFLDPISDEDEEYTTVEQIPEPERTIVRDAVRKMCEGSVPEEELDEHVDYVLSTYEDLREYEESCFWDHDFMLLDDMTEDEIRESGLNEMMGIVGPKPSNVIEFPFKYADGEEKNIKAKVIVHPWDTEDKEDT